MVASMMLGVACLLASSAPAPFQAHDSGEKEKPRDPWVFRADMDGFSGLVVMAFHERMWSAFDPRTCSTVLLWRSDMDLRGTPFSETDPRYFMADRYREYFLPAQAEVWLVNDENEGRSVSVKPRFEGYTFSKENEVTLKYGLFLPDGVRINVEESPVFIRDISNRAVIYQREFKFDGVPRKMTVQMDLASHTQWKEVTAEGKGEAKLVPLVEDPTRSRWTFIQAGRGKTTLKMSWYP